MAGRLEHTDAFEKCRKVYDAIEHGGSIATAAAAAGVSWSAAQRWLSNPDKYDPYIDEVALERALQGEYKVYQGLSWWEYGEFYARLAAKRVIMGEDSLEWQHHKRMVREGVGVGELTFNANLTKWAAESGLVAA